MIGIRQGAKLSLVLALLAVPGVASATEAVPAAAPAATPTLQEAFTAASDAAESGDCAKAKPMFEALARDSRVKPGSLPAAAIAVRLGRCLIQSGEEAKGRAFVLSGLPKLEASGEGFAEEVAETSAMLGQAAMLRYDHDDAVKWFTRAAAAQSQIIRLQAMLRLAQATQFDGDGAAIKTIDKALAELSEKNPKEKEGYANFLAVRGRVLMNLGRDKEAAVDLKRALALSGGLTLKVSLSDVALRGDLAQAMLLLGQRSEARKYLAYTGAGRIEDSPFATATFMDVPSCTGEPGLRPEDSAVVEFSIGKDGQVAAAQTVYNRGSFAAARAFAASVRDWTWKPEGLAKMPLFYRSLIRVELHCTTAAGKTGGVMGPVFRRLAGWASAIAWKDTVGLVAPARPLDAAGADAAGDEAAGVARRLVVETLRKASEQHLAAGRTLAAGAALALSGIYDLALDGRAQADRAQAIKLISAADPQHADPAAVTAVSALQLYQIYGNALTTASAKADRTRESRARTIETVLRPGLDDPLIKTDALVLDTLKVAIATTRRADPMGSDQAALLQAVADDTRLEEGHPLRQIALLQLANAAARGKQFDVAQQLFARTGLTEQQCALVGDIPRLKSDGTGGNDYPLEAQLMGFEGWVKVEYDIDAAGRTANQRALIAYPPFVFVEAATGIARGVRYDPSYRPSGKVACSATSETVRFINPNG